MSMSKRGSRGRRLPLRTGGRDSAHSTIERLGPLTANARNVAGDRLTDARRWAAPRLEGAAHGVQDNVAPRVSAMLATTAQRVEPVQKEAKKRGRRAVKELRGRKRRRWPMALLFLAVGAAAGAAVAVVVGRGRQQEIPLPPPPGANGISPGHGEDASVMDERVRSH